MESVQYGAVKHKGFYASGPGNTLHGNSTAYGRLYLAQLLSGYRRCVYLDCDLIINTSLDPLFRWPLGGALLAGDCTGDRVSSLDKNLFVNAGMRMEGSCFNSGVLVLDLDEWRNSGASELCEATARKFAGQFASADQALLNVAFHDRVVSFGSKFNTFCTLGLRCHRQLGIAFTIWLDRQSRGICSVESFTTAGVVAQLFCSLCDRQANDFAVSERPPYASYISAIAEGG